MKQSRRTRAIKQAVLSVLVIFAAFSLATGLTLAWLMNRYRLSSIGKIHPPTYISILAPGDTEMQAIDLSYDKSEVHDGRVELKRPIVIRSESEKYDLCIAHTTNISGLEMKLYEAVADGREGDAYLAGITEKGTPYYWNKANETDLFKEGTYLNLSPEAGDRTFADKSHSAHSETFRLSENTAYDKVQKYVEPLYWVKTGCVGEIRDPDDGNYYTNYILEITWDETDKETDILYVIAQTSSDQKNNGQTNNGNS